MPNGKPAMSSQGPFSAQLDGGAEAGPASSSSQVNIFVGTWNMGNAPAPLNISPFIKPRLIASLPDLYAIGVQEQNPEYRTPWTGRLGGELGDDYELVASSSLVQMHLLVFYRKKANLSFSNIKTGTVACGIGNIYGNKGGVVISMTIKGSTFAFATSHLAAHENKAHMRNQDYHRIINEMSLGRRDSESESDTLVDRFDNFFWCGDLNYRIRGNRKMMNTCIHHRMFEVMLANDELRIERDAKNVFVGFKENPITFAPTYKFDVGADRYDSSAKARIPSWTDRVLYKCDGYVKVRNYNSARSIRSSDHRPVYAVFDVGLKIEEQSQDKDSMPAVDSTTCTIS